MGADGEQLMVNSQYFNSKRKCSHDYPHHKMRVIRAVALTPKIWSIWQFEVAGKKKVVGIGAWRSSSAFFIASIRPA